MDFLLIVLAIGGLVMAIVMLVLASRASRLQNESDARVETLEALATGSVLFASSAPAVQSPLQEDHDVDLALHEFPDENGVAADDFAANEERPVSTAATFPFVMTVPAAARAGRVQVSFDRTRSRSRS